MRFKKTLYSLAFITITFIACTYYLFFTEVGLQHLFYFVQRSFPGELQINKIQGTLAKEIILKEIKYRSEQITVEIDYLKYVWSPIELWNKKIHIKSIVTNSIKINSTHKQTSTSGASSDLNQIFSLAPFILLDFIQINDLRFLSHPDLRIKKLVWKRNKDFILDSDIAQIKGVFTLSHLPEFSWKTDLSIMQFNTAKFYPEAKSKLNMKIMSSGSFHDNLFNFDIICKNLQGELNHYPINGYLDVIYRNQILTIKNSYLNIANAKTEFDGIIDNDAQLKLQWKLSIPQLNHLSSALAGDINTKGLISGSSLHPTVNIQLNANQLRIAEVTIKKVAANIQSQSTANQVLFILHGEKINYQNFSLPFVDAKSIIDFAPFATLINSDIKISKSNTLSLKSKLPTVNKIMDFTQLISIDLKWIFNELTGLLPSPVISNLKGRLTGEAALKGTFLEPKISLNTELSNTTLTIPSIKTDLKNISMQASYKTHQPAYIVGTFDIGKSTAYLKGQINVKETDLPATLQLTGKNLSLRYEKEYDVSITPNLRISYSKPIFDVKGDIIIENALITPYDTTQVINLPDETIILDSTQSRNTAPIIDVALNLNLDIKKMKLIYQNLNIQLQGKLNIISPTNEPATGVGILTIPKGFYQLYGRKLTIKQGQITYAGNLLTNPNLHLKAAQVIDKANFIDDNMQLSSNKFASVYTGYEQLTVGAWINGSIHQPKISFFSDPAGLGQSDILSYLAFGVPRSQITNKDSLAFLSQVLTSNQSSSNFSLATLTKKIENRLKLSDLSVNSTEVYDASSNSTLQTPTLNVGKKLGERLSVYYKTGILLPVNILMLKYKLSRGFVLQTETSSVETGADLLYTIETN